MTSPTRPVIVTPDELRLGLEAPLGRPAPLQSYDLAPCMYQGIYSSEDRPDVEELPLAVGVEPVHGWAYVRRDDVVKLLEFISTALNPQKEALVALEGLMGPEAEAEPVAPAEPPGAEIVDLAQALKASRVATGRKKK